MLSNSLGFCVNVLVALYNSVLLHLQTAVNFSKCFYSLIINVKRSGQRIDEGIGKNINSRRISVYMR
jgi:hypothetical protein